MLSVWAHLPLASGFTKISSTDRKSWRDLCGRTTARLDPCPAYWEISCFRANLGGNFQRGPSRKQLQATWLLTALSQYRGSETQMQSGQIFSHFSSLTLCAKKWQPRTRDYTITVKPAQEESSELEHWQWNSGPHTNLQEETPEFHPWYIKPCRETLVKEVLKSWKKLLKKILLSHKNHFNVKFVKYHPIYSLSFSSNI